MIIACAWHPRLIGTVRFLGQKEPLDDFSLSHSICDDCMFALEIKMWIDKKRQTFDYDFERFKELCA